MRTTRTGVTDRRTGALVAVAILVVTGGCGGAGAPPTPGPAPGVSQTPFASPSDSPSAASPAPTLTASPSPTHFPPAESGRSIGYPFTLQVGETVSIDGENLTVTYTRLVEDSRCAEGVQCVWAGNGRIVLTLVKAGAEPVELELNTTLEPRTGRYLDYSVGLDHLGRENPPFATIALNRA
ncbi:MAG: hypothetical protein WD178_06485 [Actinomycetota bacterium]